MTIIYDLAGQKFSNLTVISKSNKKNKHSQLFWSCKCICGKICYKQTNDLIRQKWHSCGCMTNEFRANLHKTHGLRRIPEYNSWSNMRQRCNNPNHHVYKHYGARGIKVCDRWQNSFFNFIEDMGRKPTPKHSIDRIDVNGNYEPSNCRWSTPKEQSNNTTKNKIIIYKGNAMTLKQWSEKIGISHSSLLRRLQKWDIEKALTTPKLH